MNDKLTKRIQDYLGTPVQHRNLPEGAMLLLKLTGNQLQYRKLMANINAMGPFIEQQLTSRLKFRVAQITHEQVQEMRRQVAQIEAKRFGFQQDNPASEFKAGKRADHDSLPEAIQALYVENKSIMQRMRAARAELQVVMRRNPNQTCLDGDMYPFLKELIELDKKYHENWQRYDTYGVQPTTHEQRQQAREDSRKALNYISLVLNKYRKNPTEKMKATIAAKYALIIAPGEALTHELKELQII